jgi:hypothetical protein
MKRVLDLTDDYFNDIIKLQNKLRKGYLLIARKRYLNSSILKHSVISKETFISKESVISKESFIGTIGDNSQVILNNNNQFILNTTNISNISNISEEWIDILNLIITTINHQMLLINSINTLSTKPSK